MLSENNELLSEFAFEYHNGTIDNSFSADLKTIFKIHNNLLKSKNKTVIMNSLKFNGETGQLKSEILKVLMGACGENLNFYYFR